ncbi:SDR family NAD(P)-dependent oxidoreductase [Nocardia macrotermitis]|uniref:3-oxoacyl-[acyl-carrier-protein] reductase MabA n=1 Tax=Nocardia macrotermitis TaxID=2585198 RepID=A0A7K0CU47_9NOCA|nr:SDR family NAD(P)-dependent oxidoreductase [Nocardia macrotermitis]MQY17000.1 3-oxoacyl-[acyl-carrier-protein] reductase FabG [Nocardia macrotermitis]
MDGNDGGENSSRVAIVSGAASGIGLAIARKLARESHRVALFDLSGEAVRKAAAELVADGLRAVAYQVDVADAEAVAAAVRLVRKDFGPVQIVVTSAGVEEYTAFEEITREQWNRILAVNLNGTFACIQAVVPDMVAAGWGRIVTISSSSAQSGAKNMAHYVASKGGVIGLTKALAAELSPKGITVNSIPPSIIDTPMAQQATAAGFFPGVEVIAPMTPVRRVGTPEDVAAACAYLCSDSAGFVTGQLIGVNGGLYI